MNINLEKHTGIYYADGSYAERVVFQNADDVTIDCSGLFITGIGEDAIVLQDCRNVTLANYEGPGSITVWGDAGDINIVNCIITGGHTGFRATQHKGETYSSIQILNCRIFDVKHEGIYIGKSLKPGMKAPPPVGFAKVEKCLIGGCEWDGIQIGNTNYYHIEHCAVFDSARLKKWGQDGAIQINPGASGKIINTKTDGQITVLGTAFIF